MRFVTAITITISASGSYFSLRNSEKKKVFQLRDTYIRLMQTLLAHCYLCLTRIEEMAQWLTTLATM